MSRSVGCGYLFRLEPYRMKGSGSLSTGGSCPGLELRVCVLGSGSGGNCTAVRIGEQVLLIDLGLGPVTVRRRMQVAGLGVEQVSAVCLTHLDQDHFRPNWIKHLLRHGIAVCVHRVHLPVLEQMPGFLDLEANELVRVFEDDGFHPLPGSTVRAATVRLAHDAAGTVGFRLHTPGGDLGYATDLGHVPPRLVDLFRGVHVLAIESNYDPPTQRGSPRPALLKKRIMGGAGHLSNEQAFEAVRQIVAASPPGHPQHIVLLHRSRQCNAPALVRQVFAQDPAIAQRLTLAEQGACTAWLAVRMPFRASTQPALWK
jgi:phosphoribosyl 1,2-cyclic phosphodiesterase